MSTFKILVCGLPGTGKTTLANALVNRIQEKGKTVDWYNADIVRHKFNDWDFSSEGRIRQAQRMKHLADQSTCNYVICDFVAPTNEIRSLFSADFVVWMDTEQKSDYEDTNKIFEHPMIYNFVVTTKDAEFISNLVMKSIAEFSAR